MTIKEYTKKRRAELRQASIDSGIIPRLAIIDGTDPHDEANQRYMRNKIKDFEEMGWEAFAEPVGHDMQASIENAMEKGCTSLIVQLPLREGLVFDKCMIPASMDCDGLHPMSLCDPATPKGIVEYLEAEGFKFAGKHAVIFGRSDIVGRPLAKMLLDKDMTVTVCHSKTMISDRKRLLHNADLVVCAVGKAKEFNREECPWAFVVDVGINVDENGKLCGDFVEDMSFNDPIYPIGMELFANFEKASSERASTPVPGGVGLLTRLALLENCYYLAEVNRT